MGNQRSGLSCQLYSDFGCEEWGEVEVKVQSAFRNPHSAF